MGLAQFVPLGGGMGGGGGMSSGLNALLAAQMGRNQNAGIGSYLRGDLPSYDPASMMQAWMPILMAREERPFRQQEHTDLLNLQREGMQHQESILDKQLANALAILEKQNTGETERLKLQLEPLTEQMGQARTASNLSAFLALAGAKRETQAAGINRGMMETQLASTARQARGAESSDALADAEQRAAMQAQAIESNLDSLDLSSLNSNQAFDSISALAKEMDTLQHRAQSATDPQERYAATRALGQLTLSKPDKFKELEKTLKGYTLVSPYGMFGTEPVVRAFDELNSAFDRAKSLYSSADLPSLRREARESIVDLPGIQSEAEELRRLLKQVGTASPVSDDVYEMFRKQLLSGVTP